MISQLMLSDRTNERFWQILCLTGTRLFEWHGVQHRATRDATSSFDWLRDQVNGGYQGHLAGFLRLLIDPVALQMGSFAVTQSENADLGEDIVAADGIRRPLRPVGSLARHLPVPPQCGPRRGLAEALVADVRFRW